MVGIYGIEDVKTGNLYVGQSADILRRWSYHKSFLKNGEHRYKELQEAFDDNESRIKYFVFEECAIEELEDREDWIMKEYVPRVDEWHLINRQKHGGRHYAKVKDTSNMCKAQRGENNPRCRLTKEQIFEILDMLKAGLKREDVAKKFGVAHGYIGRIGKDRRVQEYREWLNNKWCNSKVELHI
ncbi:GIY-YIG nuclease family protein [Clostridium novyi]